jgi:hypothetical protein
MLNADQHQETAAVPRAWSMCACALLVFGSAIWHWRLLRDSSDVDMALAQVPRPDLHITLARKE